MHMLLLLDTIMKVEEVQNMADLYVFIKELTYRVEFLEKSSGVDKEVNTPSLPEKYKNWLKERISNKAVEKTLVGK